MRDDADTDLVMSPEPVEQSFGASVVASRDVILPLALIDFEIPELVDLTCAELLGRFTPDPTNAIFEVRIVKVAGLVVTATGAFRLLGNERHVFDILR